MNLKHVAIILSAIVVFIIVGVFMFGIYLWQTGAFAEGSSDSETVKTASVKEREVPFSEILKLEMPEGYKSSNYVKFSASGQMVEFRPIFSYVKGDKTRVDMQYATGNEKFGEGGYLWSRTHSSPNEFYFCLKNQENWTCWGMKVNEDIALEENPMQVTRKDTLRLFESYRDKMVYDGPGYVAGLTAVCYKYYDYPSKGALPGKDLRFCFHPDKFIVLSVESEGIQMITTSIILSPLRTRFSNFRQNR